MRWGEESYIHYDIRRKEAKLHLLKLASVFHHLPTPSVSAKQLCAQHTSDLDQCPKIMSSFISFKCLLFHVVTNKGGYVEMYLNRITITASLFGTLVVVLSKWCHQILSTKRNLWAAMEHQTHSRRNFLKRIGRVKVARVILEK